MILRNLNDIRMEFAESKMNQCFALKLIIIGENPYKAYLS